MVPEEIVISKIYVVRGHKVMLDSDLADLYHIETKQLKRQVRRNIERFPPDFMIELTKEEYEGLRSQIGTLKQGQHSKFLPYAFTEHGVLMLSSVLGSPQAIQANIQIMRIFTRIRQMLADHAELRKIVERLDRKTSENSKELQLVFKYLDELLRAKEYPEPCKQIGYSRAKD